MDRRIFTRFWIIIAVACSLVALFLIGWVISIRVSESEVFSNYNQQQLFVVTGTAAGIEGLFNDLTASLGSFAAQPDLFSQDPAFVRQALERKLGELAPLGITDIAWIASDGTARMFAVETALEGIDYSWRSFFKEIQQVPPDPSSQLARIEIQYLDSGAYGFRIAIPMISNTLDPDGSEVQGTFEGAILALMTLDTLAARHLAPFQPRGGGHIFLINTDYDLLWDSAPNSSQPGFQNNDQAAFEDMYAQVGNWTFETAQDGAYVYHYPGLGRAAALVAYAPVRIGGNLLVVGVQSPGGVARQTALSTARSQQWVFLLSLITMILGVVIGGFVLRRETLRRLQLESELRQSEMEQALLAERNRLAGDLHDSVTQGLYGIVLHAGAALGQMAAGKTAQVKTYLEEIKTAARESLGEMRLLIFELRPPVLEEEGLVAALETRLYAVEKRAGLAVALNADLEGPISKVVEEGLFRIAQEALNNILKHAQATRVKVNLRQVGARVILEVIDDGRGFDLQAGLDAGGMGLPGMKTRAREMDGRLELETHPGGGTRLYVEVKQ
jgi:signal transduction histidine kinase